MMPGGLPELLNSLGAFPVVQAVATLVLLAGCLYLMLRPLKPVAAPAAAAAVGDHQDLIIIVLQQILSEQRETARRLENHTNETRHMFDRATDRICSALQRNV